MNPSRSTPARRGLAMSATAWLMVTTLVAVTTTPMDDVGARPSSPSSTDGAATTLQGRPSASVASITTTTADAAVAATGASHSVLFPTLVPGVLSARAAQREAATRDAWRKRTEQARRGAAERVRAENYERFMAWAHQYETDKARRYYEWVARVQAERAAAERAAAERAAAERAAAARRVTTSGGGSMGGGWAALRRCESGGNYGAVSSSGTYRGAYQFSRSTWNSVARGSYPHLVGVDPAAAAPADQDAMALALYRSSGARPWPHCGRYL